MNTKSDKVKRILGLLLCILIMSLVVTADLVYAEDLEGELENVQNKIADQEEIVYEKQDKVDGIKNDIQQLDEQIGEIQNRLDEIISQYNEVSAEIEVTKSEIADAEKRVAERSELLEQRVVDYYVNGQISYVEVLLDAESFSDFINRAEYVGRILQQDNDLIEEINQERAEILKLKKQLEEKQQEYNSLKEKEEAAKLELEKQIEEKTALLKSAQQDLDDYESELWELQDEAEKLADKIASESAASNENGIVSSDYGSGSATGNGSFIWPVPGYTYISSYYGYRIHPIYGDNRFHSGIDIPAPSGTGILAADSGTVTLAEWNGGYGNCIMIDHGNGMTTLYGHLSSYAVSAGQTVSQGQVIGGVGTTGDSTGNHLHFTVYVNGSTVDPLGYL